MADNKELGGRPTTIEHHVSAATDDVQNIDVIDDFDPFSGSVECVDEDVNISLSAPPEKEWYHGRLVRNQAEERLRHAGHTGSYLIRESETRPGSYVLSFLGKTGINHFRITAMCGDYYIGGREFDSLCDLIGYYASWSDLLKGERLQHPVPPPVPVNDKKRVIAILPYSNFPDTDELSFDKGEIFVVHNDMGDGWHWVTSQSSGLSGIVYGEMVQEIDDTLDPVEIFDWYHADITKVLAAEELTSAGPGSWLVRPSDTTEGDYSLYFYCNKNIQKFKIQRIGRQYYMGGRYFDSIASITTRYQSEQIVDGFTLKHPVLRQRPSIDQDVNKNGKEIYQNVLLNGSSGLMHSNRDVILRGDLNKKSQKSKKWKVFHFMLNAAEQQLYYIENQKRSKPKGLIDLSYSSLYPVHDSFFGRPNCFQIVLRALNHVSVFYLCADNTDEAQKWIMALKQFCINTLPKKVLKPKFLPVLKELRSLHLKIFDARNLSTKHVSHPYCIVSLNDVKMSRTQVKDAPDPCWDEEILLDDIPQDVESYTISIYNKCKRKVTKDTEVLTMSVSLKTLQPGQAVDEWHNLSPSSLALKSDVGSIRVRAKFLHEIIMPLQEYTGLKELLLAKDLETVLALCQVCSNSNDSMPSTNDRIPLANALLHIFRHEHQERHLLKTLNDRDIIEEDDRSTLFRGTTMATTLMDQYMKMTATKFVHAAVESTVTKIMDSKLSCEINPAFLENPADSEINAKHLIAILTEAVNTIFKSVDSCPVVLRYVCGCLQKSVRRKWREDKIVRTRVVSGFIFLRLLCLAVLDPKQFNMIQETPSPMAAKTLKLVANCLIKLASLNELKEPYMEVINPFLRDNQQRMIMFLDELSNVTDVKETKEPQVVDLVRSLATIHQICVAHLDELKEISQTTHPFIKKLVAVTEMLTTHKKSYMSL